MALTRYVRVDPDDTGQKVVREVMTHDGDIYDIMHAGLEWIIAVDSTVAMGWHYDGVTFLPPAPPDTPPPAPMATLVKVLMDNGTITQADLDAAATALELA